MFQQIIETYYSLALMFYVLLMLQDTAKVLRKFMDRDPENINFAITALVQN